MTEPNEANQAIGYFAGETSRNNIISYLEDHRKTIPDRVAFQWTEATASSRIAQDILAPISYRKITYGSLAVDIERVAQGLLNLKIQPGDRVVVFLPMSVNLYTAMFAVQRMGGIAVFLDSWARRNHLGACARCVSPAAIISFDAALKLVDEIPQFSSLRIKVSTDQSSLADTTLEDLRNTPSAAAICPVASETTALITFTTGSSGVPKGANRTHRFLSAQHLALSEELPYEPSDIDLPAFPIFCLNNLASGVTTTIPAIDLAQPTEHDGFILAHQIIQGSISCATLSPSMFNAVSNYCRTNGIKIEGLRRVVTGGAPITKENIRNFMSVAPNAVPLVLYGSTEVEPMADITGQDMLALNSGSDDSLDEGVNVGKLHRALKAKFISISKASIEFEKWSEIEVQKGEVGELVVSGDHVCRDYYNDPDAFKKAKILDNDGAVWHRTGDLGRLDEAGNLWIVGRVHNAVLREGKYHFPVRPEILLKQVAGVTQGAYLGMPDPLLNERAVVVVTADSATDNENCAARIEALFLQSGIPVDSIHILPTLPLDPRHHSKIEYDVLREILLKEQPKDWI